MEQPPQLFRKLPKALSSKPDSHHRPGNSCESTSTTNSGKSHTLKTPPQRTQKSSFGPPLLPPSLSLFHLLLLLLPLPLCPVCVPACVPVCLAGCSTVSNACVPSSGHSSRSMQEPCGRRTGMSRARVMDQHLYRLDDRALGPPPLLTWRSRLRHTTRPPGFETEFLACFASLRVSEDRDSRIGSAKGGSFEIFALKLKATLLSAMPKMAGP
jgi:hypothetical protein